MKRIFTIFTALLCLLSSCDKRGDGGTGAESAPELVSVTPADGTSDLTESAISFVLTFDQNVKCPSAGHALITVTDAKLGKVNAYGASVTVEVSGLVRGKSYTLNIPSGVVSGYKDNPCEAITISFSTKEADKQYSRVPSTLLSDASATSDAQKLYAFFLDKYGSKTVSGAMGGTAWETTYTDYIASLTDLYPGIVGFDYLFLDWPAKAWSGCPDYGDISPVKAAWDSGNIIQIGWHWNVPPAEGTSDLNEYSFKTKSFGVKKALSEGTWQHKVIDAQIAKLAGHLKLLQDAGIPALFRPLHEAAGDYSWGAWFWWGYDGAEAYKDLWIYLHDRLVGTYGLHNLIWVWTAQTSDAGQLASVDKVEAWYPGDKYVDMVGADLYVRKGSTQSEAFALINNAVKGRKIVALSEFGNLLDFDGAFSEDAPWAYFMNWSNFVDGKPVLYAKDSGGNYLWNNSSDDWKKALSGSRCLNRSKTLYTR